MKKDLEEYMAYMPNMIDKKLCKKIYSYLNKVNKKEWETHTFYDPIAKSYKDISGTKELSIAYLQKAPFLKELNDIVYKSLKGYLEYYNFPWFNRLQGFDTVRFNKYSKNTKMAEHCDHIHSMFDGKLKGVPILSILGFINDNYKGGELVMFQDKVLKVEAGSILIFPSNFMYQHKVDPVTKGTRYSFVSWAF